MHGGAWRSGPVHFLVSNVLGRDGAAGGGVHGLRLQLPRGARAGGSWGQEENALRLRSENVSTSSKGRRRRGGGEEEEEEEKEQLVVANSRTHQNQYVPEHNFRGLFCWCRREFKAEEGQENPTLLQCVVCTDWFHDGCLQLEHDAEDGCLICRDCIHHVKNYVPRLAVGEGPPEAELAPPSSCPESSSGMETGETVSRSVMMIANFREFLCQCASCQEGKFRDLFLTDDAHPSMSAEEALAQAMTGMPHSQQIEVASYFVKFKETLTETLAEKWRSKPEGPEKREIDPSDVDEVMEEVHRRMAKKSKR